MNRLTRALAFALLGCSAAAAWAEQGIDIRGTVTAFDGKTIAVATREGAAVEVALPEAVNVAGTQAFTLADLKPGTVLGVTTLRRADGQVVASNGTELMLNPGDGVIQVLVPPGTPMSRAVPGSPADIKPGEAIFIAARRDAEGKFTAARVQVSSNGVKPTQ